MAQQVKKTGLTTQGEALSFCTGMIAQKVKKGYSPADPDVALAAKKKSIGPIEGVDQAPKKQTAGPKEGDVKGALTFHHGRWRATKEITNQDSTPTTKGQVVIQDPHEHTGVTGILSFKKQGQTVGYGGVTATYAMDGLKPSIRLNLPKHTSDIPTELGAKWMPIAKVWQITLKGTPGAGGKQLAQQIHNWLESTCGAAKVGGATAPQPTTKAQPITPGGKTFKKGESVDWDEVQPGMEFYGEANNANYIVKDKAGDEIQVVVDELSYPDESAHPDTLGKDDWDEFIGPSLTLTKDFQQVVHVGDTKLENGKIYKLNANHKWELVDSGEDTTPVVHANDLLSGFPFKQIGPQAGSNPGGLYEDSMGKKWYIKFPASEDHAKNELLASKLYGLLGIDGPHCKLVRKDGKVGIASAIIDGLKIDAAALASGAPGVAEGFGADAWLGNWDTMGLGFDNMKVDAKGHAVRIDPGGALLFRAQGGPKGDAFGTTVTETVTLRDPKLNPQSASVFGKLTQEQITQSMVPVMEIPD
jgi:hypothetical protein